MRYFLTRAERGGLVPNTTWGRPAWEPARFQWYAEDDAEHFAARYGCAIARHPGEVGRVVRAAAKPTLLLVAEAPADEARPFFTSPAD